MKTSVNASFTDRLTSAQEAKKAMLARFKPKPMVTAPVKVDSQAEREAELARVRAARAAAKQEAAAAKLAAEEAARMALVLDEQGQIEAQRQARKDRKAQAKADARLRKDMRKAGRAEPSPEW